MQENSAAAARTDMCAIMQSLPLQVHPPRHASCHSSPQKIGCAGFKTPKVILVVSVRRMRSGVPAPSSYRFVNLPMQRNLIPPLNETDLYI